MMFHSHILHPRALGRLPVGLLVGFGVLLWVTLGTGCVASSSPFGGATTGDAKEPLADTVTSDPADVGDAPDVVLGPDLGPELEPLPGQWLQAPAGFCDDPNHQVLPERVIDGDTIVLVGGDRIRYIGVDAPETFKADCFAQDAKKELQRLTPLDGPVCILADSNSSPIDLYGRLLRYVFIPKDGQWLMVNARVVREGYARAYHAFLKGKDYQDEIEAAEYQAKKAGLGLWSACP